MPNRLLKRIATARSVASAVRAGDQRLDVNILPRSVARSALLTFDLDIVGESLSATIPEVGFVQIGAFDGRANDPIREMIVRFGWRGVLVEPQPAAFARLQQTYADIDGLVLVNAAVSEKSTALPFWVIANPSRDDPWWLGQIASFDRGHLVRHIGDHAPYLERITSIPVETITLTALFEMAPRPVNVLQVDAEGHDGQIVRSIDLDTYAPEVIRYEHRHLGASEQNATVRGLVARGYRMAINEDDTIALRRDRAAGATATS